MHGHSPSCDVDSLTWIRTKSRSGQLDLAEEAANLLEAGELVAMPEPPTRQVDLMRKGLPDLPALRVLLKESIALPEPYERNKYGDSVSICCSGAL